MTLSYEHNTDVPRMGSFGYSYNDDIDRLGRSISRQANYKMIFIDKAKMMYDFETENQIGMKLFAEYEEQRPLGDLVYQTNSGKIYNPFVTNCIGLELRFAYNEKVFQYNQYRKPLSSSVAPVFTIGYAYGGKYLGSDYEYHKIQSMFSKRWFLSVLGVADLNITGGIVVGETPYPLMFVHRANQGMYYDDRGFNLMNYYEFVSQYYIQGMFEYNMNGFILNRIPLIGNFKLREVFSLKAVWGGISAECNPTNGNENLFKFPTTPDGKVETYSLEKEPYIEGGIGIANIFSILRIDYVRRFNYLDHPEVDKWGIFFSVKIKF